MSFNAGEKSLTIIVISNYILMSKNKIIGKKQKLILTEKLKKKKLKLCNFI